MHQLFEKKNWIVVGVVVVDQLTKFHARNVIFNSGEWWLVLITIGCLVWVWWQAGEDYGWYFILGGGISNLIDRLMRGGVVDFIRIFSWFPWFNLADVAITIGVIWLILKYWQKQKITW